jgi:Predicted nucleotide-binding protein containing TIR-like domain
MVFKVTGLDDLQRDLEQASQALEALGGELTTVKFDPKDASSIDLAIADVEAAIDAKVASFRGNAIVEQFVEGMKEQYRTELLDRASAARLKGGAVSMATTDIDPTIMRQIENVVSDLRNSEYQSFGKHIKKLSRLLHSTELEAATARLIKDIDLEGWLKAGEATQGGMVGSATLEWPTEPDKELGTVVLLIDRFSDNPDEALNFAHTFYYSGNNITSNLQNLARQVIVPFARDYIGYLKRETGVVEPTMLPVRTGPAERKVFVVHGHDDGAREAVARYLEKLGFEAIILHEQPSRGRTIIEKIEDHGEVGFAVVLLTPDDIGGVNDTELKARARQNVILELGYFIGRLTRSRVCALKRGNVEVPSDFGGVVYTEFDENGGWKTSLAKELEAAGFQIDWNVAMRA